MGGAKSLSQGFMELNVLSNENKSTNDSQGNKIKRVNILPLNMLKCYFKIKLMINSIYFHVYIVKIDTFRKQSSFEKCIFYFILNNYLNNFILKMISLKLRD